MAKPSADAPRRKSIFWRLYMLTWAGLAGVAVIYLATLLLNPDAIEPISGTSDKLAEQAQKAEQLAQQVEQDRAEQARVAAEVQRLRQTVSSLSTKLEQVESEVASQTKTAATEPPSAATIASANKVPATVETPPPSVRTANAPPLPERGPKRPSRVAQAAAPPAQSPPAVVLNPEPGSTISTGSIARAAAAARPTPSPPLEHPKALLPTPAAQVTSFGPATVNPNGSLTGAAPAAVVVSAASTLDGLRASWQQLSTRHPALLGTLEPRYDAMGSSGPYRLLAGPLSDRVEADRLCSALRNHNITCGVSEFVGNAL